MPRSRRRGLEKTPNTSVDERAFRDFVEREFGV
jgi:hypothetical protein